MSVCLLDTSILCEILEVPGRCDHKAEVERQCALHRQRRVYIWSLDSHLSSYRRES